jgi:PTS system nitrogen regulatory IIA component
MLATLQRPIRFDAPDNNPVDLLLAIVWPKSESTGFLPALAHLCRLLRHPEFRDRIRASDTPTEVLGWMEYFEEGLWKHGKKCFRSTQRMLAEPEVARA